MASHDLEVIKKIEKVLGLRLAMNGSLSIDRGYLVNEHEEVTALSLHNADLARWANVNAVFSLLKELGQLQNLDLSRNNFSEISVLKELSQLQYLDLSRNNLSEISALKKLAQLQKLNL